MSIPLTNLKVACILDEFSYECFRHECEWIKVGPDDGIETIDREQPHLLFVESAWRGNDHAWRFKLGNYKNNDYHEIERLVAHCKSKGIPTVFWNKEDPVHFEFFLRVASLFDYVFTSDENMVARYKEKLGHDRVYVLCFAAQPKIHHPKRVANYRAKNVFFAGTYYGSHHKERTADMEILLKTAAKFGLDIFDRNYNIKSSFRYPFHFQSFIRGHLPYNELVEVAKQYKVALNVNSVKNSPTMCARRVFELLSSGITVLSNRTKAMDTLFRNTVLTYTDPLSIRQTLRMALQNEEWRRKHEVKAMRYVHSRHTYRDRLYQIATTCRLPVLPPSRPKVAVISYANDETGLKTMIERVKKQHYPHKNVLLFAPSELIKQFDQTETTIAFIDRSKQTVPLETWLNDEQFVAFFHPDHYYGPFYLTDLIHATAYSDRNVIGKGSFYEYTTTFTLMNEEHIYDDVESVQADRSIIHRDVITDKKISFIDLIANNVNEKAFSIDPFNFLRDYFRTRKISTYELEKIIC